MLLLLIIIYLAIIALEVPILMREGRGKELLAYYTELIISIQ